MKKILLAIIIFISAFTVSYAQCTKPVSVAITTPAQSTYTICQGTAQPLSGTVMVTAAAQNTSFTYSWIKVGVTPAADVILQTATIPLSANTPTPLPSYTGITGLITNAGKYILRVEDGNASNTSCFLDDTLTLVVHSTTVPGAITASQTICTGGDPAAFTVMTAASGGNGTYTYVWESDIATSGTYVPIASATNAMYDEGVLTNAGTTPKVITYRRKVTSGVCPQVVATPVQITVNPAVVAGVIAADQTICSGGNLAAFTETTAATGGPGTYTYQWQSSTTNNPGAFTNISGSTSVTYYPPASLTATTYYRRIDGSGTCATATTNVVTVTVTTNATPSITIATPVTTICAGTSVTFTATPTNGGTAPIYQWFKGPLSAGVSLGAAYTNATYTTTAATNGDSYYVVMTSNATCASPATITSNAIVMTVTTVVSPVVSITAAPGNTICAGTSVTFTATPVNGGTPTYQWRKNGFPIAAYTNATFTTTSAQNGDSYDVLMTSTLGCSIPPTATSNAIVITVTPVVVPSVTIATPATTICAGTSVTFTATPTNGGTPTYAWEKGGVYIANATNSTYTTSTAANGDSYTVHMTSNAACASPSPATSNAIVITVTTVVTPAVSITAAPGNTICAGTSVTFTAVPGNGGTIPVYEWFINNVSQGTASASISTFTSTTLANGDQVKVIMTSSSGCALAPGTATSNVITMVVSSVMVPAVSISSSTTTLCTNGSATFTATPVNGGPAPMYEWFVNNASQSSPNSSATFSTTALTSSTDVVKVILTNNLSCASPATASASMSVNVTPGISSGAIGSDQTICYNTIPAAITEIVASNALTPTYTWEVSLTGSAGSYSYIPGSSGSGYTFPAVNLTQDIYIRRIVTDATVPAPCNIATSNTIHITVRPQLVAGTISSDETICAGTAPSTITEITSPTGGTGTFTYQWESSTVSGGSYSDISSATNSSYSPGILTTTTYFRRIETSSAQCGTVYSNEVAKVVSDASATIHIDGPGQTCDGDIVLFKCKATNVGSMPIYNWYVNNNIVAIFSSSSPTFITTANFLPLKSGDEVWIELQSSSTCAITSSVISNKLIVDLVPCTISNSIYTTSNINVLMQEYVSNSVPNLIDYTYFWSITNGPFIPFVITGPNPIASGQQNAVYSVPDQTDLTYQWSVTGGTIVSGQNTNSVIVDWDAITANAFPRTTSTSYSISVTETNSTSQTKTTSLDINTITTGTTQSQAQSGINVFPNPTAGSFNIEMAESGVDVVYEILDLTGLSVASGTFTSTGSNQKIDADFGAGMYQIVLKYNNIVTCVRLSKVQ